MNIKTNKKAVGTHKIAEICHVTPPTVWQWIKEGRLPSFTTGGGHHRVWVEDLAKFLVAHNLPIPAEFEGMDVQKVLIVDDDPTIRLLVTRAIRSSFPNAEIHEARSGFEAGHKVTLIQPALVILDIRLPGTDGVTVCAMIKQNESLKAIRVLAISGNEPDSSRERVISAGADGFLAKPFSMEQLIEEVKKLLPKVAAL